MDSYTSEQAHRTDLISGSGTSVWTGGALQVGYDGLEIIGLAHLYSAPLKGAIAPGHHGYPRTPDLIRV